MHSAQPYIAGAMELHSLAWAHAHTDCRAIARRSSDLVLQPTANEYSSPCRQQTRREKREEVGLMILPTGGGCAVERPSRCYCRCLLSFLRSLLLHCRAEPTLYTCIILIVPAYLRDSFFPLSSCRRRSNNIYPHPCRISRSHVASYNAKTFFYSFTIFAAPRAYDPPKSRNAVFP